MSDGKRFIQSSIVYFIGNVLTKLMSFFLLPLYTSLINTEDVGYFDYSVNLVTIFSMVVFLNIWAGMLRFMYDSEEPEGKYKALFNGMVLFVAAWFVYTLGIGVLGLFRSIRFLFLIYLYGLATILHYIYGNVARGFAYNKLYAMTGVMASLVNFAVNILLMLVFQVRVESLYISVIVGYLIQIIWIELRIRMLSKISKKHFDFTQIKALFRFCLPLSISSILFWFLDGFNKYMIKNELGYSANGLYSTAGKFSALLTLVSSCFILAWQELAFSKTRADREAQQATYSRAIRLYLFFMTAGIALIIPAISIVFPFLIRANFAASYEFVPLYFIGTAMSVFVNFYSQIFSAEKRTVSITIVNFFSASVNVISVYFLLPRIGLQGASLSLIIAYTCGVALMTILSRSFTRIRIVSLDLIAGVFASGVSIYCYFQNQRMLSVAAIIFSSLFFAVLKRKQLGKLVELLQQKIKRKP